MYPVLRFRLHYSRPLDSTRALTKLVSLTFNTSYAYSAREMKPDLCRGLALMRSTGCCSLLDWRAQNRLPVASAVESYVSRGLSRKQFQDAVRTSFL